MSTLSFLLNIKIMVFQANCPTVGRNDSGKTLVERNKYFLALKFSYLRTIKNTSLGDNIFISNIEAI